MYLVVSKNKGREYLSIVKARQESITGKKKYKVVKSLGYLEELKEDYEDPIAHFKRVAIEMTRAEKKDGSPHWINLDGRQLLTEGEHRRKNFGYAALSKIFHELDLDLFFRNNSRKLKAEYNVSSIMKLLIYSRILRPASKKSTYEN
ncbi:MAG: hypothetical protein LBP51_06145, partial [Deferribacteraceae bacterium]|nr:hypothetical protein [Deferribacteraceae bacterium]